MIIGDALFARLATRDFGRLSAEAADLQARISSGVNDPRPSADPQRAVDLSALRDTRARIDTRQGMAAAASARLDLTDQTLGNMSDMLRQVQEIALRAANDTLTSEAHAALRTEARALRDAMLAAANTTDPDGRPLFSGTRPGPAYVESAGRVTYRGDDGSPQVQLGDRLRVATGLPGSQVFGAVPGGRDVFALMDDMIASLGNPMLNARAFAEVDQNARLSLTRARDEAPLSLTLRGPAGSARVTLDLRADASSAPVDAINAASARTGITARLDADGQTVLLSSGGVIALSDLEGGHGAAPVAALGKSDPAGNLAGPVTALRPLHMASTVLVGAANRAIEHMAAMRAAAGSLADTVARQSEALASQRLTVDQAVAGLEDLDVAATVTRLQTLLMTQQAAQQTYVKIAGQSLFDYLR